jgi:hypothetical protein
VLLDFETVTSYGGNTITVWDTVGNSFSAGFTVSITNVNEAPTSLSLAGSVVTEVSLRARVVTLRLHTGSEGAEGRAMRGRTVPHLSDGATGAHWHPCIATAELRTLPRYAFMLVCPNGSQNSAINTLVGTFSATDVDAGSAFTYTLNNNGGGRFYMTGNGLYVAANINFETTATIAVTATVTDNGSPALSLTQSFTITVVRVMAVIMVWATRRDVDSLHGKGATD